MNIKEFRQKHPEYNDIPDGELADRLYKKHYSDVPKSEFEAKFLSKPTSTFGIPDKYIPSTEDIGKGFVDSALSIPQGIARSLDATGRWARKNLGSIGGVEVGYPDPKKDEVPLLPIKSIPLKYVQPTEWKNRTTKGGRTVLPTEEAATGIGKAKFNKAPEVGWAEVKKDWALLPRWIVENSVSQLPQMAAAIANLPAFATSILGNLAHERAKNQGRDRAEIGDVAATLPAAVANALLERLGARATFGLDDVPKGFFKRTLRAMTREGLTEGTQEIAEYLSTTIDTKHGKMSVAEALDRGLQGAILGAGMGAAFRGTAEAEKKIAPYLEAGRKKLAKLPPFKYYDTLGTLDADTNSADRFRLTKYKYLGEKAQDERSVKSVIEKINTLSEADRNALSAFLETRFPSEKTPVIRGQEVDPITNGVETLPPHLRNFAVNLKQELHDLGLSSVKIGVISEEARKRGEYRYLPRLYEEYLKKYAHKNVGPRLNLDPGKHRDTTLGEDYRRNEKGQIDDLAFRVGYALQTGRHNKATADFQGKIAQDRDWTLPENDVELPGKADVRVAARDHIQALGRLANKLNPIDGGPQKVFDGLLAAANDLQQKFSEARNDVWSMEESRDFWQSHINGLRKLRDQAPKEVQRDFNAEIRRLKKAMPLKVTSQRARERADTLRQRAEKAANDGNHEAAWQLKKNAELIDSILQDTEPTLDPKQRRKYTRMEGREWGDLDGRLVRREVAKQLRGNSGVFVPSPEDSVGKQALDLWKRGVGYWKVGKVVMNPPTVMRNVMSNTILLNLSGVKLNKIGSRLSEALLDMKSDGQYWREFKRLGAENTTLTHSEFIAVDKVMSGLEWKKAGPVKKSGLVMRALAHSAGQGYGKIELVYKLAKFIDMRKQGASVEKAALEAQRTLFDYGEVPTSINFMRRSGLAPFITFQYKAAPRMLEAAASRPLLTAAWVTATQGMASSILASTFAGMSDDELDKIKTAAWPYIRENPSALFLPWKDKHGRWQFMDLNYIVPFGWMSNIARNTVKGQPGDAVGEAGINSPIFDVISMLRTGRDPFTNSELWNPRTATEGEKYSAIAKYLGNTLAPTLFTKYGVPSKYIDSLQGKLNPYSGKEPYTDEQLAPRWAGLNVYPVDVKESRGAQIKWLRREVTDARSEMRRNLRKINKMWKDNPERRDEERRNALEEGKAKIRSKLEKLRKFRKDSDVPSRLR